MKSPRFLIYGAGVIGSLYAALLSRAGYDVSVVARGRRLEQLQAYGLLWRRPEEGRHTVIKRYPVRVLDSVRDTDRYDYVFLTVRTTQFDEALRNVAFNSSPTIVTMVNSLAPYEDWELIAGKGRILPAFPGAGGYFEDAVLVADLTPRLVQPTTFGEIDGKRSKRTDELGRIFRDARIPYQVSSDMRSWQICHLATVVPLADAYYQTFNPAKVHLDKQVMRQTAQAIHDNLTACKDKGIALVPNKMRLLQRMDVDAIAAFLPRIYASSFAATFMSAHAMNAPEEMKVLHDRFYGFLQGMEGSRDRNPYLYNDVWYQMQGYLPRENRIGFEGIEPRELWVPVSGGINMHLDYYAVPEPKGRVVLFHGVGGNGRLLAFAAVPLARAGYEVVCPDLPLYGYTHCPTSSTYEDWVRCGTELVSTLQGVDDLPLGLVGFSAGGMLAYQVACRSKHIAGLAATCLLDFRNPEVLENTASSPLLGNVGKPLSAVAGTVTPKLRLPMSYVGNMEAIVNEPRLAKLLMDDKRSAGATVSARFLKDMLAFQPDCEPDSFDQCPVLLAHPGQDRWTGPDLSLDFFGKLPCEKEFYFLDGAGHFPIEEPGITQLGGILTAFFAKCFGLDA